MPRMWTQNCISLTATHQAIMTKLADRNSVTKSRLIAILLEDAAQAEQKGFKTLMSAVSRDSENRERAYPTLAGSR